MSASFLKKLAGFTAVLVALLVFDLYRQVPHARAPFEVGVASAQKITMESGTQKVELAKKGAGWEVDPAGGPPRPADESKMNVLLSALKSLQIEEEISNRADRHAEYQVDAASGTSLALLDDQGKVLASGIFGKQAPDFTHSYFRYPDKPLVYLARGVLPGDLGKVDPTYWIRRQETRATKPSASKTK